MAAKELTFIDAQILSRADGDSLECHSQACAVQFPDELRELHSRTNGCLL